jgi:hypothetical protein
MKHIKLVAILATTLVTAPLMAQATTFAIAAKAASKLPDAAVVPVGPKMQMPAPEAMIIMIRSSLVALSQANMTNNYTVLNQMGSADFRAANSPARLGEIFAPFRTNNIDLAPVVFVTPQLAKQPFFDNGRLRLVGFFPTQPMRVDYDLTFEPAKGVWRLFGLSVNLSQVPVARPVVPQPTQSPRR